MEEIEVFAEETVFRNDENGYTVLTVKSGRTRVSAVGVMPPVAPGEKLRITGEWVEHPVYGQLTAALQLSSRYDVDQYMDRMATSDARPLSLLTEGIHLHTLSCPNEDALVHLKDKLRGISVLLEAQN